MALKKEVFAVMGRTVLCDFCSGDYTDSDAQGGILVSSKATCPECVPRLEGSANIKARCPDGMSFADWVRDVLREDPSGECVLVTADSTDELFEAMFGIKPKVK